MSTVFVYGDSFGASYEVPFDQPGLKGHWTNLLAEKLNYEEVNNAVCGSNKEYAFTKLVDDNLNNRFVPGDVIVFVQPSTDRMHLAHTSLFPHTSAVYTKCFDPDFLSDEYDKTWYMSNYHYLKWYVSAYDQGLDNLYAESYITIIDSIALANPKCKFFHLFVDGNPGKKLPINYTPNNVYRSYQPLIEISAREVHGYGEGRDVFAVFASNEYRINHLCVPNLHILANAVYDCTIAQPEHNVIFNIDKGIFMSNIIGHAQSDEEYMDQVNHGLVYYSEHMKTMLNNKYQKMAMSWTKYFK